MTTPKTWPLTEFRAIEWPPSPFRCSVCDLPYWIARACGGTFDHATGKRLPHAETMAVRR